VHCLPARKVAGIQEMYKAEPAKAKVVFSSTSELTTGLRSTATIRNKYKYAADEPEWLGGTDSAPNPVEMLLASLGTCQVWHTALRVRTL
jgi:putative redox protein